MPLKLRGTEAKAKLLATTVVNLRRPPGFLAAAVRVVAANHRALPETVSAGCTLCKSSGRELHRSLASLPLFRP